MLLDGGADKEKATIHTKGCCEVVPSTTPLIEAARNGCVEVTRLLLTAGAVKDHANAQGEIALYAAARGGHYNLPMLLGYCCKRDVLLIVQITKEGLHCMWLQKVIMRILPSCF